MRGRTQICFICKCRVDQRDMCVFTLVCKRCCDTCKCNHSLSHYGSSERYQ